MKTCLLMIGDGRDDVHDRSVASSLKHLPTFDRVVTVDDTTRELGFAGAIAEGWRQVLAGPDVDWVFHLELDFLFHEDVPLERMIGVLVAQPKLAQMSLKRQAVNDAETAAGGIVEAHPDDFTQMSNHGDVWTEHRRYFTTNPSVYPAALCQLGWPQVPESEGHFTHQLLDDPELRFGIWGPKFAAPAVQHIGTRAGHGY